MLRRVPLLALAVLLVLAQAAWAQNAPGARNPNQQGNDAAAAAGAVGFLVCMGISVLIGIGIKIWIILFIVKDARKCGMDPTMWVVLEIFVGLVGLIIYLCVREPLLSERGRRRREGYDEDDDVRPRRRDRDDDEDDRDDDRRRRRDDY